MILFIDNYDSFTFNVVQAFKEATDEEIRVVRNDEYKVEELAAMKPKYLVVSPGPGNPSEAGISKEAIRYFAGKIPVLGVCLGHQAIAEAFGAKIVKAKFIYDVWGDTVNVASRMETAANPGAIRISEDLKNHLEGSDIQFSEPYECNIKGKGMMKTFEVIN